MAFDLNKNDGSDKVTPNKTQSTSKFDLSKSDAASPVTTDSAPSSKKLILGLVGILVVGGGIWVYSSKDEKSKVANFPVAEVVAADSGSIAVSDTGTALPSMAEKDTTSQSTPTMAERSNDKNVSVETASLNNKTVASFAQGSFAIRKLDQSILQRIVFYLTKNPDAAINILGYASSDGSLSMNQIVSQARADAFKKLLISKNVAESRIAAIGKGIQNPIASNSTNAGRKRNRRIEIAFK